MPTKTIKKNHFCFPDVGPAGHLLAFSDALKGFDNLYTSSFYRFFMNFLKRFHLGYRKKYIANLYLWD